MADFGAIVHRREPDNPVKDGALSQPFCSLQMGTLAKALTENAEGLQKGSNSGSKVRLAGDSPALRADDPDGSVFYFFLFP